jgi:hypothetical protein
VVEEALEDPDGVPERDPGLDRYTGIYDTIWGQSAVVRWEDGLAVLDLQTRDPKAGLVRLKKSGERVFVRIREDDEEQPGEEFVFDAAENGTATRFKQHSNWSRKVR